VASAEEVELNCRMLTSLYENYDQPLPSVTARYRRSSKIKPLLSRDQRKRSIQTVFIHPHARKLALLGDGFFSQIAQDGQLVSLILRSLDDHENPRAEDDGFEERGK
jgi:hypothetical protein